MADPYDLTAAARRVGEAVWRHDECRSFPVGARTSCAACRAEAAALVELRALREQIAKAIEVAVRVDRIVCGDTLDWAASVARALGEPAQARSEK